MKYRINLLPTKEVPFTDKLMFFLMNYLRYIIVITQLVVIGVFFFRFQVDQKIIDLKESVEQKKEIVQIVLPLLQEAEHIDKKSKEVGNIIQKQKKFESMMEYILSVFPETVTLTDMILIEDSLRISGDATDARQLQAFLLLLKKEGKFNSVEFKNIRRTPTGYSFVMSLDNFVNSKI